MKKLLTILFIVLSLSCFSQMTMNARHFTARLDTAASPLIVYTENFDDFTNGGLNSQGNFIQGLFTITVAGTVDKYVHGGQGSDVSVSLYDLPLTDDQYCQLELIGVVADGYIGTGVRLTGSGATLDGYFTYANNTVIRLYRFDNGIRTQIGGNGAAPSPNDIIRIDAVGTTISVYVNDVLEPTIGNQTDATYSSGVSGIVTFNDAATSTADNFEAGDK